MQTMYTARIGSYDSLRSSNSSTTIDFLTLPESANSISFSDDVEHSFLGIVLGGSSFIAYNARYIQDQYTGYSVNQIMYTVPHRPRMPSPNYDRETQTVLLNAVYPAIQPSPEDEYFLYFGLSIRTPFKNALVVIEGTQPVTSQPDLPSD